MRSRTNPKNARISFRTTLREIEFIERKASDYGYINPKTLESDISSFVRDKMLERPLVRSVLTKILGNLDFQVSAILKNLTQYKNAIGFINSGFSENHIKEEEVDALLKRVFDLHQQILNNLRLSSDNRNKEKKVGIRVTLGEKKTLEDMVVSLELKSMTELFRITCLTDKKTVQIDKYIKIVREVGYELNDIIKPINEIMAGGNGEMPKVVDIRAVFEKIGHISQEIEGKLLL